MDNKIKFLSHHSWLGRKSNEIYRVFERLSMTGLHLDSVGKMLISLAKVLSLWRHTTVKRASHHCHLTVIKLYYAMSEAHIAPLYIN